MQAGNHSLHLGAERGGERERQRETETDTERQRKRQRETETERDRDRERKTETERETERQRQRKRDRDRERQRERETEIETDRETETERERDGCSPKGESLAPLPPPESGLKEEVYQSRVSASTRHEINKQYLLRKGESMLVNWSQRMSWWTKHKLLSKIAIFLSLAFPTLINIQSAAMNMIGTEVCQKILEV